MSPRQVLIVTAAATLFAAAAVRAAEPAQVYARSCAPCHGKEGKPSPVFARQGVKDFTDPAWKKATTDAQVEKAIREGKKGTMMASFEKQLSPQEIKALVSHVRKLGAAK